MNDDFNEIMNNLSENARFAIQKSDYYAKRYNNGYVSTEHLLLGILAQDTCSGAHLLFDEGVSLDDVEKQINAVAVEVSGGPMALRSLSEAAILTLRMANKIVRDEGMKVIGTEHILYALVSQPNSRASLILEGLGVDLDGLVKNIEDLIEKQAEDSKIEDKKAEFKREKPLKWLKK